MAEQSAQSKTEQATPRRLEKAREKGQVAYSSDLTGGIVLGVISVLFVTFFDWFLEHFNIQIANHLYWTGAELAKGDHIGVSRLIAHTSSSIMWLVVPIVFASFVVSGLIGGVMTGFRFAPKAMALDLDKLNPVKGFSKIFSSRSVVRGVMAILKLVCLVAVVYGVLRLRSSHLAAHLFDFDRAVAFSIETTGQIMLGISAGLILIGMFDYLYQKWKHLEDMKMTRQELVDERREDDGDPHMRARIKRLQRELAQRQMLSDVASSTVVVTNPSHFAVAIRYDRETMNAPQVAAKGADFMAEKIKEIARAHRVAIVERKPLARALYYSVNVGAEIPLEFYEMVAEVLAYIYRIERAAAA